MQLLCRRSLNIWGPKHPQTSGIRSAEGVHQPSYGILMVWWAEVQSLSFPDFDGPILMGFWWAFPFPSFPIAWEVPDSRILRCDRSRDMASVRRVKNVYHILWDLCMTLSKLVDSCATPPLATTAWLECIRQDVEKLWEAAVRIRVALRQKHMRYYILIAFVIFTSCFPIFIHRQIGTTYHQRLRNRCNPPAEKMPLTSLQMKVSPKHPWS